MSQREIGKLPNQRLGPRGGWPRARRSSSSCRPAEPEPVDSPALGVTTPGRNRRQPHLRQAPPARLRTDRSRTSIGAQARGQSDSTHRLRRTARARAAPCLGARLMTRRQPASPQRHTRLGEQPGQAPAADRAPAAAAPAAAAQRPAPPVFLYPAPGTQRLPHSVRVALLSWAKPQTNSRRRSELVGLVVLTFAVAVGRRSRRTGPTEQRQPGGSARRPTTECRRRGEDGERGSNRDADADTSHTPTQIDRRRDHWNPPERAAFRENLFVGDHHSHPVRAVFRR